MAEEEKQEPVKPAKKPFALSMPIMIGIGVLIVIIMFVVSLFAIKSMFKELINARVPAQTSADSNASHNKSDAAEPEEESSQVVEKGTYVETGRITTNPKGSTSFVVVNLGLVYKDKNTEAKPSEEGKGAPDVGIKNPQLEALIRQMINNRIGEMTVTDIQMFPRDSLAAIFKKDLTPVFKGESMYLKGVILKEFIIQ